jgi:transcription-repair coupling factor (superfamily II helicase)
LDKINNDKDLAAFSAGLEDRFGKIPEEGQDLIRVVQLKWLAQKLGVERLTLRAGKMNLYLVNDMDSPYYQSKAFGKVLQYVQQHYKLCTLKEANNKRMVSIAQIAGVEKGYEILNKILR